MSKAKKIFEKAKETAKDKDGISNLLSDAVGKLKGFVANSPELKEFRSKANVLVTMTQHHLKGEYRAFSNSSLILVVFALLYFVIPTDAIPDFIPALGFTDDAAVLLLIYKKLNKDIEAFLKWKEAQ